MPAQEQYYRPLPHHSAATLRGRGISCTDPKTDTIVAYNMASRTDKLGLPAEVNVQEAAEVLAVSARTVKRYVEDGLLAARNIAPLRSVQAQYRIRLEDVIALRTAYQMQHKPDRQPVAPRRRPPPYTPRTMKKK